MLTRALSATFLLIALLSIAQSAGAPTFLTSPTVSALCVDNVNNLTWICTAQVNASDNVRASIDVTSAISSWFQANYSPVLPSNAIILNSTLLLEHQQSKKDVISVNVSFWNSSTSTWVSVCSFPPLPSKNKDFVNYCDLTNFITNAAQASDVRINFSIFSTLVPPKAERIDFTALNITYLLPANLTGVLNITQPANGSLIAAETNFTLNGSYAISCVGEAGEACGETIVYLEWCAGADCSNWQQVSDTSIVRNVTQSVFSCGFLSAGDDCSSDYNSTLQASAAGVYRLRLIAASPVGSVASQPITLTFYGVALTGFIPPLWALCFDPAWRLVDCTLHVNSSDDWRTNTILNKENPSWTRANWSIEVPANAYVLGANFSIEHQQETPATVTVNVSFLNLTTNELQPICILSPLATPNVDAVEYCAMPFVTSPSQAADMRLILNITSNAAGWSAERIDALGINVRYRTPLIATDSDEYVSNSTVVITGYAWQPNATITLNISGPSAVAGYPKNVTTAQNGSFVDTLLIDPELVTGFYRITASHYGEERINATKMIFIRQTPYVRTNKPLYSGCGRVWYRVQTLEANGSPINVPLTISILNALGEVVETLNVSTIGGLFIGNYLLPFNAMLGTWLIKAIAGAVGEQSFVVGHGGSDVWKIDLSLPKIRYSAGESFLATYTVRDQFGLGVAGLWPNSTRIDFPSSVSVNDLGNGSYALSTSAPATAGVHYLRISVWSTKAQNNASIAKGLFVV